MVALKWIKEKKARLIPSIFGIILLVTLVACAPRQAPVEASDPDVSDETPVIELPTWSEESDCASCHTTEVSSGTDSAATFSVHETQADMTCLTCHTNTDDELALVHAEYSTATAPTRLTETSIPDSTCLDCHVLDELKAATSSSTVLTDYNGLVVNPHEMPDTNDHERNVRCSTCHKMHSARPLEETAKNTCLACHHQGVYECGTCH